MQIVYGYCREDKAASLLGHFVEQGDFVSVKELGAVGREHIAFAALLSFTGHLSFPFCWEGVHFVAAQKQAQSVNRLTLPISNNACKKRYRKLKNTTMTPNNWKQHISRNRGLKYVNASLIAPM
ncbi:conserved hypothetical protein [Vibrio crassostreae]|uniref:Uncharacterized protein n=1 Tax=Vibrio coralliirubri TaxID=1516159 RepID=A0AA86X4V0_9VIBR|nr:MULTISPECIES: hypothetical protein [Vibrio]CAH7066451.1 conserved hypothetical protein [Vibrio chagasii]TCT59356.1 hypothetical protein EDB44_11786 [Vibrio crassostreae]TCT80409.1 hypothetical protein EDB43_11722 [Vibrio crassostreae]TCT95996.1 hypothetical protein EDB47_13926 [Vibrio crassostreae]TDW07116.1 hypothetical protein EDB45_11722 [Vibrio crassostreae]